MNVRISRLKTSVFLNEVLQMSFSSIEDFVAKSTHNLFPFSRIFSTSNSSLGFVACSLNFSSSWQFLSEIRLVKFGLPTKVCEQNENVLTPLARPLELLESLSIFILYLADDDPSNTTFTIQLKSTEAYV